jgi:hypothetical protein
MIKVNDVFYYFPIVYKSNGMILAPVRSNDYMATNSEAYKLVNS